MVQHYLSIYERMTVDIRAMAYISGQSSLRRHGPMSSTELVIPHVGSA
jgi:hypothetical protein